MAPIHVVLDTSYVMEGPELSTEVHFIITPFVQGELEARGHLGQVQAPKAAGRLSVMDPEEATIDKVEQVAKEMDLAQELSLTDLSVLALGVETGHTIWTFDLDIVRVAERMGLEVFPDKEARAIRKALRCSGCGKWLSDEEVDRTSAAPSKGIMGTCLVCGSPVRSKKK